MPAISSSVIKSLLLHASVCVQRVRLQRTQLAYSIRKMDIRKKKTNRMRAFIRDSKVVMHCTREEYLIFGEHCPFLYTSVEVLREQNNALFSVSISLSCINP